MPDKEFQGIQQTTNPRWGLVACAGIKHSVAQSLNSMDASLSMTAVCLVNSEK